MTLNEIAQIYTDLVSLDNQIPEEERVAKDETGALRSKVLSGQFHPRMLLRL